MKTESSKFGKTVSHNPNDIVGPMPDTSGIFNASTTSSPNTSSTSSPKWWETTLQDLASIGTSYLEGLVNGGKPVSPPSVNAGSAPAPKDNTALYVGIGAGALVFLVIILVLLKK